MELTSTWTEASGESSINKLLVFIKNLPNNIEQFISPETSNLNIISENLNSEDLSFSNIQKVFSITKENIEHELLMYQRRLKYTNILNRITPIEDKIHRAMTQAGLEGDSLNLKFGLLDKLWRQVIKYINITGLRIIDFANNELVKLIRKFLSYLNSLLDSLKSVFPFIESMKEFKDIIEGYLDLAEELK